ncbi:MAG TPA: cellulase family glycosylhydrolase, partial [Pontiella sp.]|nr:cellulase family glycosylhydrolase [Pontiella sp.]
MNRNLIQMGVAMLSLLVFSVNAFAVRGRPHIDSSLGYNRLLTDQNSLLRGVSLSWDGGDPYGSQAKVMPTQAQLNALANEYGLNTVHLYLEGDSTGNTQPIGYNASDCDTLVQRCANAGLYLIITIGCNGENGTMDLAWSQDFWEFYAPRYKDETHVIYEAHNEPVPNTLYQWTASDWDDQAALYATIRTNAPDTFILLGSFMGFVGDARPGANYLAANGVSWSNAGFAHHGYESKVGIEEAISYMETSTNVPALLCTEFGPQETEFQGYNSMYESHFNGWMQFQWLAANDFDLYGSEYGFKTRITKAGTIWIPDVATCTWPVTGSPTIPAHGSFVGIYDRGTEGFVRIDGSGDLKADLET